MAAVDSPEYASVLVDVGARRIDHEFHYRVPPHLRGLALPGYRVRVPFGPRMRTGLILSLVTETEVGDLKDIAAVLDEDPVIDPASISLADWVADRYLAPRALALRLVMPAGLRRDAARPQLRRTLAVAPGIGDPRERVAPRAKAQQRALTYLLGHGGELTRAQLAREAGVSPGVVGALLQAGVLVLRRSAGAGAAGLPAREQPAPTPTPAQAAVLPLLERDLESDSPGGWLLHGVTGSGKTEVYLRVVERALAAGRGAIVLVPEIGLTPQTVRWFRQRLGPVVAVLHSGLAAGQRYGEWERARRGDARVVVGARSAIFAPVRNLGVVVVDEEQDRSYKQDEAPHYHAREVAAERARRAGALLLLGSATPAVETYHRARSGQLGYLRLADRVGGRPLPRLELVDMRSELAAGNRSMFSRALSDALLAAVTAGHQAVLFINRRGYASFLLCRSCGHVIKCPHCAVSLTLHLTGRRLLCHYCDHRSPAPDVCPACESPHIRPMGAGTERVAAAVGQLVPGLRVVRMDTDTTRRRGAHERIYDTFRRGEADVLVGTQMVAKGWDIPNVTLVGVMAADIGLHMPDFRTGERTFQLLTQVAGRAGRGRQQATVIVQTYNPDNPAIAAAARGDQEQFFCSELESRRQLRLPPFASLTRLLVRGPDGDRVAEVAQALAVAARTAAAEVTLLGPAPAPFARLRGQYRWHLAIRGESSEQVRACLAAMPLAEAASGSVRLVVDVDPETML